MTLGVDGMGDQFFARSVFTRYEHGGVRAGNEVD